MQRKISGRLYQRGAVDYLVLLGIAQTCRFQEKSFLNTRACQRSSQALWRQALEECRVIRSELVNAGRQGRGYPRGPDSAFRAMPPVNYKSV